MKPYYVLQKELIFRDAVILRKQKLLMSNCLRHSIFRLAYEEHISIVKSAINEGRNWKYELNIFLLSYRTTPHCTTGDTPFFLLFSRVVRDNLPTVLSIH